MNVSKYVSLKESTGSVFIHAWDILPVDVKRFGRRVSDKGLQLFSTVPLGSFTP